MHVARCVHGSSTIADAHGSGKMKDDVVAIDQLGQQRLVGERVDHVREFGMRFEVTDIPNGAGRQVVDDIDFVPLIEQGF